MRGQNIKVKIEFDEFVRLQCTVRKCRFNKEYYCCLKYAMIEDPIWNAQKVPVCKYYENVGKKNDNT